MQLTFLACFNLHALGCALGQGCPCPNPVFLEASPITPLRILCRLGAERVPLNLWSAPLQQHCSHCSSVTPRTPWGSLGPGRKHKHAHRLCVFSRAPSSREAPSCVCSKEPGRRTREHKLFPELLTFPPAEVVPSSGDLWAAKHMNTLICWALARAGVGENHIPGPTMNPETKRQPRTRQLGIRQELTEDPHEAGCRA